MKKVMSFVLVITMILSIGLQINTVNAEEIQQKSLPQVGQVISGFRAEELGYMEIINAKTVLFEHEKTGAQLYYIQSKDINRSFEIAFKTPAVDDTGANHILEHITISGSKKYPMKNVLFTIANQTYSTFINAFTSATSTAYPVASMSEEQLLKLSEVYLDCVFNPSIYTDKNIFLREAWRYEMADENAPLVINGTVYNEMKGSLGNISTAAYYNVLDALFPSSIQANNSGGDPEKIKDLTYEELIDTHKNYYHPSNSLMILYGDLDYSKFLEMINEVYLKEYDKREMQIDYGIIAPRQQKTEETYKFPVSEGTNTANAAQIDYAFALNDVSQEDIVGLSILATLLNQDSSPLKKTFAEKQIGGQMSVSFNNSIAQPILTFTANNADESKKNEFMKLVDNGINDLLTNGFDKDSADAVIAATLLSNSNLTEMSNLGVEISMSTGVIWANTGRVDFLSNVIKHTKSIAEKIDNSYLEDLTKKYIQKNNHAALVTTIPEAGLSEQLSQEHLTYLADLKAAMSKQEIEKIVSDTKSYNEWNSNEGDPAIANQLQVVKVADLPVEVKSYNINDKKLPNGVRMLSAPADVGETGYSSLLLDTSVVPVEKLHFMQLYAGLLGRLDTSLYTKEQLSTLTMRYLSGASFNLSTIPQKDWNEFTPVITTTWMGLMSEYEQQIALVKEILINTRFTDAQDISVVVKEQVSGLKNQITNNPVNILVNRNMANLNACNNYQSYLSGLEYYGFLTQLEQTLKTSPDAVLAELQSMQKLVLNQTNMITLFAGNESSIKTYETQMKKLIDALPANALVSQDYTKIPRPAQKEGIALNTPVQYNMISAGYESMNTTYSGKYIPIGLFIYENYITPQIRFGYGAYDNIVNFSSNAFMLVSYRDPNIKETFDVYRGLPEFIRNTTITQDELDRYILNAFSTYTATTGELSGAFNTMNNYLMGKSTEDRLKVLQQIKSTTVADLKDSAAMFEGLLENGAYSTVGSPEKIEANRELYDMVISFGLQSNEPITRAQFIELLLAGVPQPLEVAKQMGLLLGDGKGNYNENERLTMEQLAVIINRLAVLNGVSLNGEAVTITDEEEISLWARGSVQALVASGIAKLDEHGNFSPKGDVNEAVIQAIVNELMKKLTGA